MNLDEKADAYKGTVAKLDKTPSAALNRYRYGDLIDDPRPRPSDIVHGLLRRGENLVIAGPPKSRKTFAIQGLSESMAMGVPFLGMEIPNPARVFVLQAEMPWHATRERARNSQIVQAASIEQRARLNTNLVVTDRLHTLALNAAGVNLVTECIHQDFPTGVDVIVIDALADVFDGDDESHNTDLVRFLRDRLGALRALWPDVLLVLVHHTRKERHEMLAEDPFTAIRGGGGLRGWYDVGIVMHPNPEDSSQSQVHFELRDRPPMDAMFVELEHGCLCLADQKVRTYGGEDVTVSWSRVASLLKQDAKHGVAHTVRSFADKYAGIGENDPLQASRPSLIKLLEREVTEDEGAIYFATNPSTHQYKGAAKRGRLLAPTGYEFEVLDNVGEPIYSLVKSAKKLSYLEAKNGE